MLRPFVARTFALALVSLCLGACAGYRHVRFQPNPLDVRLARSDDAPTLAFALVSVRGIEEAAGEIVGWELAVRMRLENEAGTDLVFVPEASELVDGALDAFPPPRVGRREPALGDPFRLSPGESGVFDLIFPFPAGYEPDELDLSGLSLRWTVEVDGARLRVSSTFERVPRNFPDDRYHYYDCHPWLGFHYHGYYVAHPYRY